MMQLGSEKLGLPGIESFVPSLRHYWEVLESLRGWAVSGCLKGMWRSDLFFLSPVPLSAAISSVDSLPCPPPKCSASSWAENKIT